MNSGELPLRNFIPDIENEIKRILKELDLVPKKPLKSFLQKNKRFYSAPALTKNGKLIFFKILIVDEEGPAVALKREIEITKFLTEFLNNSTGLKEKLNIPVFINADAKNFPYWFLHQYIKGPLLGHFYEIYEQGKKEKNIPKINDNLTALHALPQDLIKKLIKQKKYNLWIRTYDRYLEMIESYQKNIKNKTGKIDFQKIYKFFENRKKLFEKQKKVLAHGDFTLANFFLCKEKVYLTDWEQAHIDNFAYDISHLWIQLWRYPVWRKKIILDFLSRLAKNKIQEFKELFRAIVITEALGELRWSSELCEKKYKKGVIKTNHKAIKNSLKSFNQLIGL